MDQAVRHADVFVHLRIIIGMVLGLSLSRLVIGLTRFIQHPRRERIYPIHIGWVLFLLLAIIHFWWYEFALSGIREWTFPVYFFLIVYASLFVAAAALLFPDRMDDYKGFEDYFQSRRQWFYGLLAVLFVADVIDTLIKGSEHFHSLGIEYPARQAVFTFCALVAVFVPSRRYQGAFVAIGIVYQISWILRLYDVLA